MQPLKICIGPIIRIGRESWCLPYAGFLNICSAIEECVGLKLEFLFQHSCLFQIYLSGFQRRLFNNLMKINYIKLC